MTSRRSLLYEGYADSYEEPHRRRPTSFDGPILAALNAYYYPSDMQKRESFIEGILEDLGADSPRCLAKEMASYHSYGSTDVGADLYRLSTPLIVDTFKPAKQIQGKWRVEVHREYICIVLFVPIKILNNFKRGDLSVIIQNPGMGQDWKRTGASSDCRALMNFLYDDARKLVGNEFDDLANHIRRWCDQHKIAQECEPKLFADFFGGCLPWTYFKQAVEDGCHPVFPEPHTAGLPPEVAFAASEYSARFLQALTTEGAASTLLGQWPNDCVACYMQNGHSIYISNVGKRQSDKDETPLKYLVLYADRASGPKAGGISSPLKYLRPSSRGETASQPVKTNPRLTRFIGRIHDVGVARLAALRNMKKMKEFNNVLRRVEFDLQSIDPAVARTWQLRRFEKKIEKAARNVGESVHHRSIRASYYLGQLQRIADDLGIVGIDGFQDYRQFVRRNLYQSIENIVTVGRRYQAVLEQMNAKQNATNSVNLLHIQRIADMAASIIVIYYIMSIPGKLAEYITDVGIGPPWTEALRIGALCLGLVAYWLMSLRVYRLANEMNRERPGRASIMIWAARLFAFPHLLFSGLRKLGGWMKSVFRRERMQSG